VRPSAWLLLVGALVCAGSAQAGDAVTELINYRQYSPTLSSAGQPTTEQFEAVREAGFERVIFLAFSDHHGSLPNEDRVVAELGMEYIQIPVVWEQPRPAEFDAFAAVMQQQPGKKTLVHCQVNYRASAFSFLYRVLFGNVPMDQAKDDMNSVWVPNETWRRFIFDVLEANGRSPYCDQCLWEDD
jgi:protein tyrosine phosphatase (PTP) superfamily phosphohydrolase (DUF442 family)